MLWKGFKNAKNWNLPSSLWYCTTITMLVFNHSTHETHKNHLWTKITVFVILIKCDWHWTTPVAWSFIWKFVTMACHIRVCSFAARVDFKYNNYLNNYFNFHVRLSFRPPSSSVVLRPSSILSKKNFSP